MNHTIKMFLKFGQEEHIRDLYENGTLYMNPIQYFRSIEDNELRGDSYEGVSNIRNLPPGQFTIPILNYTGNYQAMHLRQSHKIIVGNIFSLFAISTKGWENPEDFKIDPRLERFGSHCLVVMKNPEFLSRIEFALKLKGLEFYHNFVDYYDKEKVNGDITLFEKPLEFEYQKEFRFYVKRQSDLPLTLSIGSLKGIAEVYESKSIIDTLELRLT